MQNCKWMQPNSLSGSFATDYTAAMAGEKKIIERIKFWFCIWLNGATVVTRKMNLDHVQDSFFVSVHWNWYGYRVHLQLHIPSHQYAEFRTFSTIIFSFRHFGRQDTTIRTKQEINCAACCQRAKFIPIKCSPVCRTKRTMVIRFNFPYCVKFLCNFRAKFGTVLAFNMFQWVGISTTNQCIQWRMINKIIVIIHENPVNVIHTISRFHMTSMREKKNLQFFQCNFISEFTVLRSTIYPALLHRSINVLAASMGKCRESVRRQSFWLKYAFSLRENLLPPPKNSI